MTLEGKVCVVTGATRGIGRATLERLVGAGADVIGTYLNNRSEAENISMDLPVEMHRIDMGNSADLKNLTEHVKNHRGHVDVLVNNAGICERLEWPKVKRGIVQDAMLVNFQGPLHLISMMTPLMAVGSSIVNLGSVQAHIATAQPHYTASKAALHAATKFLAKKMAPRVRVNTVAPGYVDTEMTAGVDKAALTVPDKIPLLRFGHPDEIAKAIAFLADEEMSGYMTGETMNVNGGMYMP
jgi:3-oxoacyl-[acyl-carrier protein] reductase